MKQLKKSNKKVFAGVCGGIAECLKIDPTIVRLIVCILALFTNGIVVVLYIVAAFIMPSSDESEFSDENIETMKSANMNSEEEKEFSSKKSDVGEDKSAPHSTEEFNSFFENK